MQASSKYTFITMHIHLYNNNSRYIYHTKLVLKYKDNTCMYISGSIQSCNIRISRLHAGLKGVSIIERD